MQTNPGATWTAVYPDGRALNDTEVNWDEIAAWRDVGLQERLSIARDELASLSAHVNGRSFTVRSPGTGTRFFRHYGARVSLTSEAHFTYHAIGYLTDTCKVTLEIDGDGNATLRPIVFFALEGQIPETVPETVPESVEATA